MRVTERVRPIVCGGGQTERREERGKERGKGGDGVCVWGGGGVGGGG